MRVSELNPLETESMDDWSLMESAMHDKLKQEGGVEEETEDSRCFVCYLPDGDIHVCKGPKCEHLELNEDKCYVCRLSGFVFGTLSVRDDYSTGRQAGSSNPDDHAGEPVGGQWKPKKDMVSMSTAAYGASDTLKQEESTLYKSPSSQQKDQQRGQPAKRGARCVDEPVCEDKEVKRSRHHRNAGCAPGKFRALVEDAEGILCKLVNFDKRVDAKKEKEKEKSPAVRDARLMNKDFLFQAAMKKYTKECIASGTVPSLDAIHNIAIASANIAADEKRKADAAIARQSNKTPLILKVRMREQVTTLACSLWVASCNTPYMEGAKRGADSFRPFVCGVFYALKRGVSLPDGTVVVPACPQLAEALPALRATAANSCAKALHASSHRGICTLHRSISSCSVEQGGVFYATSAHLARALSVDVKMGRFDLF